MYCLRNYLYYRQLTDTVQQWNVIRASMYLHHITYV